jgi:hypothetical protein
MRNFLDKIVYSFVNQILSCKTGYMYVLKKDKTVKQKISGTVSSDFLKFSK